MPDEEVQELGREGVAIIKRWLEATTFMEMNFDAYHHHKDCIALHLDGRKKFDLSGRFLHTNLPEVFVECKRYSSPGGQFTEFMKFLAIAYSATLKEIELYGRDGGTHYMWVTFHPFNLDNWAKLETAELMRRSLAENPAFLQGNEVDEDLLRAVAERIMVLVFNPKQEHLSLTRDELLRLRTVIDRKVDAL